MPESLMNKFNNLLSPVLSVLDVNSKNHNPYLTGLLGIFLIGYAGLAAPKLPRNVIEVLAGNPFVKVLFMGAIVWLFSSRRNPALAILIAVSFLITTMLLDKHRLSDIATAVQMENDSNESDQSEQATPEEEPVVSEEPSDSQPEPEVDELVPSENTDNEYFKDDAPTCEQYQEKSDEDYKKYTHNNCNLVSQGCGIKTMENQCGAQGLSCQPNWIPEGYGPY